MVTIRTMGHCVSKHRNLTIIALDKQVSQFITLREDTRLAVGAQARLSRLCRPFVVLHHYYFAACYK